MTTQLEFITAARNKLYEASTSRFTDEMLRGWLNDVAGECARRTQCLRATDTIAVTNGTQQYTGPADMLSCHAVGYQATGSSQYRDLEYHDYKNAAQLTWTGIATHEGTPLLYWTWGYPPSLEIHLYPTPSESGTLTVHYYKDFEKLSTDTTDDENTQLDFPVGWDSMIVDGVVAEAMLSDRDQRHEVYRQRFELALTGFADQTIRFNDQPGSIMVGNNVVPQWLYDFNYD